MLNVHPGDRVQVKREHDEGYILTQVRTPPGTVTAVKGSGMDARVVVELDGGQVMAFKPGELDRIVLLDLTAGRRVDEDHLLE
jgi:hypothetical protein